MELLICFLNFELDMRFGVLFILMLFISTSLFAQLVYKTKGKSEADVIVFVSKWKNEADLLVYKTTWKNEADKNDGIWYFTDWKNEADNKVYFTEWKNEADIIIYYTEWKNEAGWKNDNLKKTMEK